MDNAKAILLIGVITTDQTIARQPKYCKYHRPNLGHAVPKKLIDN